MPPSAQAPSRPTTRSMTTTRTRRSTRLTAAHHKIRSSSSSSAHIHVRTRTKRRSKASPPPSDHPSNRPKKCSQADSEQQLPDANKTSGPCESSVRNRPDRTSRKTTAPNHAALPTANQLEKDLKRALEAEKDLTLMVKEHEINAAKSALVQLEEYFACPLCFEVMAYPYSLNPRHCGHSFCATCILKWFFSRLHLGCGGWHEAVDCPICRSPLCCTPDQTPRPEFSFPFTPNRTADIAIRGLISTISADLDNSTTTASNSLSDWYADGHARQEWSKRERAGRTEMTSLAAQWDNLRSNDFVNIKARLEV